MSAIEPRPLRADARRNRERILEAAWRLLAERGPDVQIDDIARTAGVGVGTVYRHFPSKDELIGELLARKFRDKVALAQQALEIQDPWEAFASFLRDTAEWMARDASEQQMWWAITPASMAYAEAERDALVDVVDRVIVRAQGAGVLHERFSVDDVPTLMCGLGANMQAQARHECIGRHDWRRLLEDVLAGVRVEPSR